MFNSFQTKIYNTFRALKYKNYRLFFFGQCISLIGTWIQQVAMSWLIYKLTNSAFLMGLVCFVSTLPALILSPFAGVFIDRMEKKKALVFVQFSFLIEAFILAVLTLTNLLNIWNVLIISLFMGVSNAIDMPLRQAFVVQLVDDNEDLSNAISLNSSCFNLARLIGPAIAGVLIAIIGEGWCFMINALSYIAVIWALLLILVSNEYAKIPAKKETSILEELKEGFNYSYNNKFIWYIFMFIGIASLSGMAFQVVMPIYAKEILKGGAQTLGYLMSAAGIGALIGALYLSSRTSIKGLSKWTCASAVMFGSGLIGLKFISNLPLALLSLSITGFGMVVLIASCNTIVQYYCEESKRGRVMGLYTIAFFGTAPFGSLIEGTIADKLGISTTYLINGIILLILAYWFSTKLKHFTNQE
ncbi:MAG: MFS transporter [Clostridiaceae bacterium]|nr:MFS transporter [Clostridiaceae bacterium]